MDRPRYREAEARRYSGKGDLKFRIAIQDASKRRYYSPDEQTADQARWKELEDARAPRAAKKATRATRPNVPPEFAAIRAACRNMLDCDRLSAALETGWSANDINFLARQFSEVACGVEMKETPSAIRFTLEMIQGKPGGELPPYLPRRNKEPLNRIGRWHSRKWPRPLTGQAIYTESGFFSAEITS
ncbi:hypothetical protein [Bradyrhizobium sp. USDA 326]|uniref:hypothetical protein n=1 Tax=Bradyrhizobium sp. USDA 326 TaxID=3377726 RepID=UPI003C70E597